jgi:hypothetical protein
MADEDAGVMPIGQRASGPIAAGDVKTTPGDAQAPTFHDEAAATIVWEDYNRARNYLENNAWLLDWQENDLLYYSTIPNRFLRFETGRPARVARFLVAKATRVMARAVKRALFGDAYCFDLTATGETTEKQVEAWKDLVDKLLRRGKFEYHAGLAIDCQSLQGTTVMKAGWEERQVVKKGRRRKKPAINADMPAGGAVEIHTKESDAFETFNETVTQSYPIFEYRRLGTTLFDPKWSTPGDPDESAGYAIDIDYVNFADLQRMRLLSCYEHIPDDETLKAYFINRQEMSAPIGSQIENTMSSQGSAVTHAEARNRQTSADPLEGELMLLERWDLRGVKTILVYDGRKLLIRNDDHDHPETMAHYSAVWWPVENSGYGMGNGRLAGPDQRIEQGTLNEALKMIAYPMNAPIIYDRGTNAPTQNVIARLGGFWALDLPNGGDVRKAVSFLEMPQIPPDAWKVIDYARHSGEDITGADSAFQQGNLPGPGSSAARTATGANRIASKSDDNVADPVDSFEKGIIVPIVKFIVHMVKLKMPLEEIRDMLSTKHAAVIEKSIDFDQFLEAEFETKISAGARLAMRAAILQFLPFFMQIVQQPQLLEYLHQRGETIDFEVLVRLMQKVSALSGEEGIIRDLTEEEWQKIQQMQPGQQKTQGAVAVEKVRGQNKQAEIHTQGEVDLGTKAAEIGMEHLADGNALIRAEGLVERGSDEAALKGGLSGATQ